MMRAMIRNLALVATLFFASALGALAATVAGTGEGWTTYRVPQEGYAINVFGPLSIDDPVEGLTDLPETTKEILRNRGTTLRFSVDVVRPPTKRESTSKLRPLVLHFPIKLDYSVTVQKLHADNKGAPSQPLRAPEGATEIEKVRQSGVDGIRYVYGSTRTRMFLANGRIYKLTLVAENGDIPPGSDAWFDTWKLLPSEQK